MTNKIKTAYERAMEKVADINISSEELNQEEKRNQGKSLAGKFLGEESFQLEAAVNEYSSADQPYVVKGILESLMGNLSLPTTELAFNTNQKALQGITRLKRDKNAAGEIVKGIETLFEYYVQSLKQAQMSLQEELQKKLQEQPQMQQQMGGQMSMSPEVSAEFQREWLRTKERIDQQYEQHLREYKNRLMAIE